MSATKALSVVFLAVIAIGAALGIIGTLTNADTEDEPTAVVTEADGDDGKGENNEYVTWVEAPDQNEPSTPAQFAVEEIAPFEFPDGDNIAKGKKIESSGYTDVYPARQSVDGRDRTYWEGEAFPSWIIVDLESATSVSKVVLQVPPLRTWGKRTQTLSVGVSLDKDAWTTVFDSQDVLFDSQTGNAALIEFASAEARYVKVDITANTGAKGGQLSELYIYE